MYGKFNYPNATKYRWITNEYQFDRSQNFGTDVTKEDIMTMRGPDAIDHTDWSDKAMQWYEKHHKPISQDTNPFYDMVRSSGGIEFIDHDYVTWKIPGKPMKDLRSMGEATNCSVKCLGMKGVRFKVRFNTEHLRPGNVLIYVYDPSIQIKIVSKGVSYGSVFEYEAVNYELDTTLRPQIFKAGNLWLKSAPMSGVVNAGDAGIGESGTGISYLRARVGIGVYKWEQNISYEAWLADKVVKVMKCKPGTNMAVKGYEQGKLLSYTNMVREKTMKNELEIMLSMGRYSKHHIDSRTTSFELQSPGFLQWMEQARLEKYTPTLDGFGADVMGDLSSSWDDATPWQDRVYHLYGGEAACFLFHKWVEREYQGTVQMTLENSLLKTSEPFDNKAEGKTFSPYQFTGYKFPMFGKVYMHHWPFLDNQKVFGGRRMPGTKYPIQSFEVYAFPSKSKGSMSSGLQLVSNRNKNHDDIFVGKIAPNGRVGKNNPIWKSRDYPELNGFKMCFERSLGLIHFRPSTMRRYIPDIA